MAVIHRAELQPTKRELLAAWLPQQPWGAALDAVLGAYRLDDPDGEVGIEVHIVRGVDGVVRQVPATYRAAPLTGAALIGTTLHSVLGQRWVHDGCTDPVAVAALATTIRSGGAGAEEWVEQETGPPVRRQASAEVRGVPPVDDSDGELVVRRVLDETAPADGAAGVLLATWNGQEQPVVVAHLT
ncbi:maltokinase N-terminal cap-like domain-containing protein [Pseudonocardia sp. CA-107938]|uniref:maltokinase N-terminal cap-like domain-containing protein n=1 Tax=Pseudonocardia sp. CA-107938 TaxID=3240021 RepID=UPI003D9302CE